MASLKDLESQKKKIYLAYGKAFVNATGFDLSEKLIAKYLNEFGFKKPTEKQLEEFLKK